MRSDFNKQLTERQRIGHEMKFGDIRNAKGNGFDEEAIGGKESIHTRRRHARGRRKSFNEHLNPLKSFLRTNEGRPWDKVYSDICSTFDKRKVINNHILEHLFDYVKLEVYIIDGKPHELNKFRYSSREYDEIEARSHHYPVYYVDPRDGILKAPKPGKTKRECEAERAREIKADQDKTYRRIDEDNHLFFNDGVWWQYTAKQRPPKIEEKYQPYIPYGKQAAWNALTYEEKQARYLTRLVDAPLHDQLQTPDVSGFSSWGNGKKLIPSNKYFYKRQAASHKLLKQFGLVGTATIDEEVTLSHRERSKFRVKK